MTQPRSPKRPPRALLLVSLGLLACGGTEPETAPAPSPVATIAVAPALAPLTARLVDVTEAAGIHFNHTSGAFGKKYLPETMGSGLAFLDYDGDGRPDLFLVNARPWPGRESGAPPTSALYRNRGDGTFEDVTVKTGLAVSLYGIGVTAGDYDSDGDPDLFVTTVGPDRLFRNDAGVFRDVTTDAGIADDDFGASATWVDPDKDGDLDLFVGNYVHWALESDIFCTLDGKAKSYCTPESYQGASPRLWRNDGKGKFADATKEAGLYRPTAKALGVVAVDYDLDSWPDIIVANDTQPNYVFRNKGDGTFEEVGMTSGIAFNENGVARGAMGIDAGDYDGIGRPSLVISNFSNEMLSLYRNEGHGLFVDAAPSANIGRASLLTLAFGCFFFDFDLDGQTDILVANGHVEDEIAKVQPGVTHAEPPHLFRNVGDGKFEDVAAIVGADFAAPKVARGAAYADIDGDGDLDVALSLNAGPARLYRNEGIAAPRFVRVTTVGTRSNREGFGAVVRLVSGGRTQTAWVKAATSYASQSERAITFGLGATETAERLEITWPSGQVDTHSEVPMSQALVATEGASLAAAAR